jgi:hypothetical protein
MHQQSESFIKTKKKSLSRPSGWNSQKQKKSTLENQRKTTLALLHYKEHGIHEVVKHRTHGRAPRAAAP